MTMAGGNRRARWGCALAIGVVAVALAVLQSSPAAGDSASAGGGATASRAKTVSIVNFAFKPGKLTVARGTKVNFSNTSGTTHTATSGSFDTGRIKGGESAGVRFKQRGTFAYHCKIHPFMKGKIVVQ
jgi:plastocyanin